MESRRVVVAKKYLVKVSACHFGKLQYCLLYCAYFMISKVMHIIDLYICNINSLFSKRMYVLPLIVQFSYGMSSLAARKMNRSTIKNNL